MQSNGLRVLSLLPNFDVSAIPSQTLDALNFRSWIPEAQASLASSAAPILGLERFGFQMRGVERPELQRMLIETALKSGVEIKWDHALVALEQGDEEVRVHFSNGATDTASFAIGCDGLHSSTRTVLFGKEQADFTGCTQVCLLLTHSPHGGSDYEKTGGVTIVDDLKSKGPFAMSTIYGNGTSLIMYPIASNKVSWAYVVLPLITNFDLLNYMCSVTQREAEAHETWRIMDKDKQEEFKKGPLSQWGFEGEGLISNAYRLVKVSNNSTVGPSKYLTLHISKYRLYDRPELTTWHKDRIALLGDAAHPTSPVMSYKNAPFP